MNNPNKICINKKLIIIVLLIFFAAVGTYALSGSLDLRSKAAGKVSNSYDTVTKDNFGDKFCSNVTKILSSCVSFSINTRLASSKKTKIKCGPEGFLQDKRCTVPKDYDFDNTKFCQNISQDNNAYCYYSKLDSLTAPCKKDFKYIPIICNAEWANRCCVPETKANSWNGDDFCTQNIGDNTYCSKKSKEATDYNTKIMCDEDGGTNKYCFIGSFSSTSSGVVTLPPTPAITSSRVPRPRDYFPTGATGRTPAPPEGDEIPPTTFGSGTWNSFNEMLTYYQDLCPDCVWGPADNNPPDPSLKGYPGCYRGELGSYVKQTDLETYKYCCAIKPYANTKCCNYLTRERDGTGNEYELWHSKYSSFSCR